MAESSQPNMCQPRVVNDVAALAEAFRTFSDSQRELLQLLQNSLGLRASVIPRNISFGFKDMDDNGRREVDNRAHKLEVFIKKDNAVDQLSKAMELLLTVLQENVGPDFNLNPAVGTGVPESRKMEKPVLMIKRSNQDGICELKWAHPEKTPTTAAEDINYIRQTWSVNDNTGGYKIIKVDHKLMYDDEGYPTANLLEVFPLRHSPVESTLIEVRAR
jgi:hypothetical protein